MEKKDLRRCNIKKMQPGCGKGLPFCGSSFAVGSELRGVRGGNGDDCEGLSTRSSLSV